MKILMVCLGNICRSPLAEGILRTKLEKKSENLPSLRKVVVDSAGTGNWHVGEHPDQRAIQVAKKFGVDISGLTGRQFSVTDFDDFDKIFVMDKENYNDVIRLARTKNNQAKVHLLLNADEPDSNRSVPDPYYGREDGFIRVFKMIEKSCDAIVERLVEEM